MKIKEAVKLYLDQGTTIRVLFKDGVTKSYDVLNLAKKFPQLNALKDRKLFLKGRLFGWSGVIWYDDLDISVETVYEDGVTVDTDTEGLAIVIGYHIKQARLHANLTQEELAEKIKIDQADLSRIEKGTANPSVLTLARIAEGLGAHFSISLR